MHLASIILLLSLTGAAAICDLMGGTIPNTLIATGIICSLVSGLLNGGIRGLCLAAAGMLVPLGLLFALFLLCMMGAGDIKLLCMTGSFLGPKAVLNIVVWSFLFGGAISAFLLVRRRNLFSRFHYFIEYLRITLQTKHPPPYLKQTGEDGKMCFAVPVFFAVACYTAGLL